MTLPFSSKVPSSSLITISVRNDGTNIHLLIYEIQKLQYDLCLHYSQKESNQAKYNDPFHQSHIGASHNLSTVPIFSVF